MRRELGNLATWQLAGPVVLFASTWSYADVSQPLRNRLNDARLGAPQAVNDWLDGLTERAPDIYALVQVQGGGWCAITAGADGRPSNTRCIQPETSEERSLGERLQAKQAADAARRGAMSEQMHQHLRAHPDVRSEAMVWARFASSPREDGARLDPGPLQAGLLALCDAHLDCRGTPMPGVPAVSLTASPDLFRQLARNPMVGAIDYVDPAVEFVEQVGGPEMTMECVRIDEANISFPTVDGTGAKIAVVEAGMPFPNQTALIDPSITTNCPGVANIWHAGQTLSVLKGDSSGSATPRAIEGAASGAELLVAGRSAGCFTCSNNADCSGGTTCDINTGLCNYLTDGHRLFAAMSWAAAQGANVINASFGVSDGACGADETAEYDWASRMLDYFPTQDPWPVLTKAAGNHGIDKVSGGSTYNGVVVGGVDHQNDVLRSNHQMWNASLCSSCEGQDALGCASTPQCVEVYRCKGIPHIGCEEHGEAVCNAKPFCYWDFVSCHGSGSQSRNRIQNSLEVPHVVAPARQVLVLSEVGNWWAGTGTSWATPHVSGIAARILQASGFQLASFPEAVRAILMASAEDVDGNPLRVGDWIDDDDGAGEVDALEAERIANPTSGAHQCWGSTWYPCAGRGVDWGWMDHTSFDSSQYYGPELYFSPLSGTSTVQIVLTWMVDVTCDKSQLTCSGGPSSALGPFSIWLSSENADGSWTLQDSSMSFNPNDNYLFINSAVDPAKIYKLELAYLGTAPSRSTYYGLAWTTR